jgi:SPP1 gp7 family putative phage head morphogenesis protein
MVEVEIYAKQEPPEGTPDNFKMPFNEEYIEVYLLSVYTGAITIDAMDLKYHYTVASTLEEASVIGFGGTTINLTPDSPEFKAFKKMRSNIYAFSAAKQYQQVRKMSQFISQNGITSTYQEFRKKAYNVFEEFNKNYLKTEYNTAIGQSQMAKEWVEAVQKRDLFPVLEYRTQKDGRVRDEHAVLDGIKLPINHSFWNNYMPKNGWNCRCFVVSHDKEEKVTNLKERDLSSLKDEKKFPAVFRMNPGKDGLIFNPKYHPYFFVERGASGLKKNNFNMPQP